MTLKNLENWCVKKCDFFSCTIIWHFCHSCHEQRGRNVQSVPFISTYSGLPPYQNIRRKKNIGVVPNQTAFAVNLLLLWRS